MLWGGWGQVGKVKQARGDIVPRQDLTTPHAGKVQRRGDDRGPADAGRRIFGMAAAPKNLSTRQQNRSPPNQYRSRFKDAIERWVLPKQWRWIVSCPQW